MADIRVDSAVSLETSAKKLADGVIHLNGLAPDIQGGCRVFVHYNGPTDQLPGMCTGMAVLDPGRDAASAASPPRRGVPDRRRRHRRDRVRRQDDTGRARRHHVLRRQRRCTAS